MKNIIFLFFSLKVCFIALNMQGDDIGNNNKSDIFFYQFSFSENEISFGRSDIKISYFSSSGIVLDPKRETYIRTRLKSKIQTESNYIFSSQKSQLLLGVLCENTVYTSRNPDDAFWNYLFNSDSMFVRLVHNPVKCIETNIKLFPNFISCGKIQDTCYIDSAGLGRYVLMNYYDLAKNKDFAYQGCEPALLKLFAWEPYGRYWELKAKDFEALKKMNELKISAFEKLLKKTENDPQFAKLYLENRPDSYNPERRIIKRKPEALEKAWQKFSARWEKENLKLVPKFKIIPLLPESDSQMKK